MSLARGAAPVLTAADSGGARLGAAGPLIVSLATSGVFLGALLAGIAPGPVLEVLGQLQPAWLLLAFAALAAAFALKAQRWAAMLRRSGTPVRFRDAAVPLVGSAALDNLFPSGTGRAIRMIALQSFAARVTRRQLATLDLEKLLDLCALGAIALVTLAMAYRDRVGHDLLLTVALLAASLTAVAILLFGFFAAKAGRTAARVRALLAACRMLLSRPAAVATLAGLTLGAWLAEGVVAFAAAEALGLDAVRIAALAVTLAAVSRLLPSLPGGFGPFDFFVASAAMAVGAAKPTAVAYALLLHGLLWVPTTVTGWLLLIRSDRIGVFRRAPPHPA